MIPTLDELVPGHDMVRVKELGVPIPKSPGPKCYSTGCDPKSGVEFFCNRREDHGGRHAAIGPERIALRVWS